MNSDLLRSKSHEIIKSLEYLNQENPSIFNALEGKTSNARVATVLIDNAQITAIKPQDITINVVNVMANEFCFSINDGAEKSVSSNVVSLETGVSIVLHDIGVAEISFKRQTEPLISGIIQLTNAINAAIYSFNENTDGCRRFSKDLMHISHTFASSMLRTGIRVDIDGFWNLDMNKLQRAAEDGKMPTLFSNKNFSVGMGIERIAIKAAYSNFYINTPYPVETGTTVKSFA